MNKIAKKGIKYADTALECIKFRSIAKWMLFRHILFKLSFFNWLHRMDNSERRATRLETSD